VLRMITTVAPAKAMPAKAPDEITPEEPPPPEEFALVGIGDADVVLFNDILVSVDTFDIVVVMVEVEVEVVENRRALLPDEVVIATA